MERIAPLAKILAEANGIDWQNLQGTGEGGQIVEQDILNHLARIMSGEEEPPSTPVDAPPPDWNGEDIPGGGMFNADMLSKAGVDSDIAAFVEQTRPATPAPQVEAPTVSLEDDMEFELDEEEPEAPAATRVETPAPAPVTDEPVKPEPAPAPAAAGLGSLLSRLYKTSPAQAEAEPTPAEPRVADVPAAPEPVVLPPVVDMPAAPTPVAEPEPTPMPAPAAELDDTAPTPDTAPIPALPDLTAPAEEPVTQVPPVTAMPEVPAAPVMPVPAQPTIPAAPTQDATWFGIYLRRDANIAAISDLRSQLSDALGQDVPLALLVARAAQRHADRLHLNSVALHDGQRTRSVTPGHLRDTLSALNTDHEGTPDLLVVDAGARGLDDLHYPHTLTLSVGRAQDGRAALSLNGNVDAAQAAQLLTDIADTLERPIVLVL